MYYIDGYNLLFRLNSSHTSLQHERNQIIEQLNRSLSQIKLEAVIVFDSTHTEGPSSHSSFKHLHVVFTAQNETADEWIFQAIRRATKPQECTVVTSDRKLAGNVRALKAKVTSVETFLSWLNKKQKTKQKNPLTAKEELPPLKERVSIAREGSIDYYLKIFEERYKSGL